MAPYESLINETALRHGIDPMTLRAFIAAESGYDPFAESNKQAVGLMQLTPVAIQDLGIDPTTVDRTDPATSLDLGAQYINKLINDFGIPNDPVELAAAYNAGPGAYKEYGGDIPYPETIAHRERVKAFIEQQKRDKEKAESVPFDPEGSGYDYDSAIAAGLEPDDTGHWPSRVPETGLLLKGRGHETFIKTLLGEKKSGYHVYRGEDGRYYSKPEEQQAEQPDQITFREGKDELTETREAILGSSEWALQTTLAGLSDMTAGYAWMASYIEPGAVGTRLLRGAATSFKEQADALGVEPPQWVAAAYNMRHPLEELQKQMIEVGDRWEEMANHDFPQGTEASPIFRWLGDSLGTTISNTGALRFMTSIADMAIPAGAFARHLGLNDEIAGAIGKVFQKYHGQMADDITSATQKVEKAILGEKFVLGNEKQVVDEILSEFSPMYQKEARAAFDDEVAKIIVKAGPDAAIDDIIDFVESYETGQLGHIIRNHVDFINTIRKLPSDKMPASVKRQLVHNAISRIKAIRDPVPEATRAFKARHIVDSIGMPVDPTDASRYLDDYSEYGKEARVVTPPSKKEVPFGRKEVGFRGEKLPLIRRLGQFFDARTANAERGANLLARSAGKGEWLAPFTTWSWMNRSKAAMTRAPIEGKLGFWVASGKEAPGAPGRTLGDYGNLETVHKSIKQWMMDDGLTPEALGLTDDEFFKFANDVDAFVAARHRTVDGVQKLAMHDRALTVKSRLKRVRASIEAHRGLLTESIESPSASKALWSDWDEAIKSAVKTDINDPDALAFAVKQVDDAIERTDELIKRYKFHISNEELAKAQRAVLAFDRLYMETPELLQKGHKFAENITSSYHALLEILSKGGRLTAREAREIRGTHEFYTYVKRFADEVLDEVRQGRTAGMEVDELLLPWRVGDKVAGESPIHNLMTRAQSVQGWYADQMFYKAFRRAWLEAGTAEARKTLWPGFEITFSKKKPGGGRAYATIWDNGKPTYMSGNDAAMEEILKRGFGELETTLRKVADVPGIRQLSALFRNSVTMSIRFAFKNLIRDAQSSHILGLYPYESVLLQLKSAAHLLPNSLAPHTDGLMREFLEKLGNTKYWDEMMEEGYAMSFITDIDRTMNVDPVLRKLEEPGITGREVGHAAAQVLRLPANVSEKMTRGGAAIKIFKKRDKMNRALGLPEKVWFPREYIDELLKEHNVKIRGVYGVPESFEKAFQKKKYPLKTKEGRPLGWSERFNYFYEGAGGYPQKSEALYDVRDMSVDFNRFGKKVEHINALYPFFNASQRELARIYKQVRDQPLTTLYRATRMSGSMSAYENAKFYNDPDYRNLPAYRRLAFWTLKKDPDTGEFLQIPVGFMSGMITKFIFDRWWKFLIEKSKDSMEAQGVLDAYNESAMDTFGEFDWNESGFVDKVTAGDVLRGSFKVIGEQMPYPGFGAIASIGSMDPRGFWPNTLLGFIPHFGLGIAEVASGWDLFRGKEINYEASLPDRGLDRLSWFDEYTSPTMIGLANAMDKLSGGITGRALGPRDLEHLVESYFGNVGMDVIRLFDEWAGEHNWGGDYPKTVKYLKPSRGGPFGVAADIIGATMRKTLWTESPHGTKSQAYDTYHDVAREVIGEKNTLKSYIRADKYKEAAEMIKESPGILSSGQLIALFERLVPHEDVVSEFRNMLGRDPSDTRLPRAITTPLTIIQDTDDIKEYFANRISENAMNFAKWEDEHQDLPYKEREKEWEKYRKAENSLRRAQTNAFRHAIGKIKRGDWSQEKVEAIVDNFSVDDIATILREERIKDVFEAEGVYDKRIRKQLLDLIQESVGLESFYDR